MSANQEGLFKELDKAIYGDNRRLRPLFIPRILNEESVLHTPTHTDQYQEAFTILKKWAQLDIDGKLAKKNEVSLQGEFIADLFVKALGYNQFSKGNETWDIEQQYKINGGTADAAIGYFKDKKQADIQAIIELKKPSTNVDRDRSAGRTAIQQCWDYLDYLPDCPWGIVCNYVSFRLYHRGKTPRIYELFALRDLADEAEFRKFYHIFQKDGLLNPSLQQLSRATVLLNESEKSQQVVGDDLYKAYDHNRKEMIIHLTKPPVKKDLGSAIRITQKLLDRVIFIAFCEDRDLVPDRSLEKAHDQIAPFSSVVNPRWQNFLDLFRSMDKGNSSRNIPPFNGGLFREDPEVDNLNLSDDWTNFFANIGRYDFRNEVNVEVLGHLFEKSINDIEYIKRGGLFESDIEHNQPKMDKSAKRKRSGVYYTPPEFTNFITAQVVGKTIEERFANIADELGLKPENFYSADKSEIHGKYWTKCFDELKKIKTIDPACGSGAFLISAYDVYEEKYIDVVSNMCAQTGQSHDTMLSQIPDLILNNNIYGVDLSKEAVEITQLALWIRSARPKHTLSDLSKNIICGNSLISNSNIDKNAVEWQKVFSEIFSSPSAGFDCVIGNPPWERLKLQEREYFDSISSEIASAVNAARRRKLIDQLKRNSAEIHERYTKDKEYADSVMNEVRQSGEFPLTGKGDINTYSLFAELATKIVSPIGRIGLLVPSGIATDNTTKDFFASLIDNELLCGLFDFENKKPIFPDVHRSFKFSVLLINGFRLNIKVPKYAFFLREIEELREKNRIMVLTKEDIELINPNSKTCPIFRSDRDANLTRYIYKNVPVLVDRNRKEGGNPWGIGFSRMFDQTNDAELFRDEKWLKTNKYKRAGALWQKGKQTFVPLYEAKMIQMYDHRAASVKIEEKNWMRQGQTISTTLVQHQNPEYFPEARWWIQRDKVTLSPNIPGYIAFKDVTSATNQRTMIAAYVPPYGMLNSIPLIITGEEISEKYNCCLLANLNILVFDFVARQKVGGVHLNFFIIEQLPIFPPDFYDQKCPWEKDKSLLDWISERVLKLTCTSNDMAALAEACNFQPHVHKWNEEERLDIMAELDAAYFILYGINKDDAGYIISTFQGINAETGMFSNSIPERIFTHYDRMLK